MSRETKSGCTLALRTLSQAMLLGILILTSMAFLPILGCAESTTNSNKVQVPEEMNNEESNNAAFEAEEIEIAVESQRITAFLNEGVNEKVTEMIGIAKMDDKPEGTSYAEYARDCLAQINELAEKVYAIEDVPLQFERYYSYECEAIKSLCLYLEYLAKGFDTTNTAMSEKYLEDSSAALEDFSFNIKMGKEEYERVISETVQ